MDLVARVEEVPGGGDAALHRAGADVEQPGVARRHEGEPYAGTAAGLQEQQVRVDELGGEGRLGGGPPREGVHEVGHVVADQGVDAAVAVLADVVDPGDRIALVGLGLGTQARDVPGEVGDGALDVGEDGDRVGVALAARDVAVGAGHGAAVGRAGGDPVRGAAVGPGGERLLLPQDQRLRLDPDPAVDVPLVAVEVGDPPVGVDGDDLGVGVAGEDLPAARGGRGRGFGEDRADGQQPARGGAVPEQRAGVALRAGRAPRVDVLQAEQGVCDVVGPARGRLGSHGGLLRDHGPSTVGEPSGPVRQALRRRPRPG